jgi:hypothetical protein
MAKLLLYNPCLSVAFISWIIAQVLKVLLNTWATHRVDFSRLVDSGGMPSSHTALVAGLSTSVGITQGWHSYVFAVVLCFSLIVIYDATNLRRSAGNHAEVLNELVAQLLKGRILRSEFVYPRLRELLGHNPFEVFVGALLGIGIAFGFSALAPTPAR